MRWLAQLFIAMLALIVPSLFLIRASGQSASQGQAAPSIVTNVDEVSLDLVVRDKRNKPVVDLKPEDITVLDNGTAVKLSDLRLVSGESSSQRLVTLVFDRLGAANATNARNIAGKILKDIPQDFSLSVLSIDGRLKLNQDFTSDRASLAKAISLATEPADGRGTNNAELPEKRLLAIAKTGNDDAGTRVTTGEQSLAQVILATLEDSQRIVQEQHTSPSLAALLALSRSQRRILGRKVVIYFAQGLPVEGGAGVMLGSIIGAASRSGVSIYAVDVNALTEQVDQGLMSSMALGNSISMSSSRVSAPQALSGPPPTPFGDASAPGMKAQISNQFDRFELRDASGSRGPLADLAEGTGGAYIHPGENPRKPLRKMIDEMTTYYEASYVPPINEYDGQFRPVEVKAVRGDLKIRSQAGYYALPSDNGSGVRPFEVPLLKILSEAQLPADLKFRSGILQTGELSSGETNTLLVEVPVSELETQDDPNTNLYSLHVSIVAQIKNKAGEVIQHFSEDVPRRGALDAKGGARAELVMMQRHFVAEPGEYVLETVVLDRNSGKAGAHVSNFMVTGTTAGPALSDLALVQRMDPFPEETDPAEPLRYGGSKVVPTLSDRVAVESKSISLFSMIHPDPQSNEQPRLEMAVLRNNEPIVQVPLQLRKTTGPGAVPYVASMQTGSLPPGNYQVIETLTQGAKVAERSLTIRIEGPQLASAAGSGHEDAALSAAATLPATGTEARRLVITALPPETVPTPSPDELQAIIAAARKHALGYSNHLPNFVCVEVTNRSVDASGNGNWKRRDTFSELLRYADNQETRTMLEMNGKKSSVQRSDLDSNLVLSAGEFGHLLNLVFSAASKADFEWKEAAALGSETVQVLSYRVARENATIEIGDNNSRVGAGFHGLVYIDAATGGVRRITLQADDLPRNFSMHGASIVMDYDYVAIGAHDYLMPMRTSLALQRGRRQTDLNEMAFRNYRRYASQTKITVVP
jgi:VWFA-related protein